MPAKTKSKSAQTVQTPQQSIPLANGKVVNFTPFKLNEKNFRKIRIHRNGSDGEGIWAAFSDADVAKYDSTANVSSTEYDTVCILVNDALNFYPNRSWGMYIPVKFGGANRPRMQS